MSDPFAIMTPGQPLESGVGPFNRDWHNAMSALHARTTREQSAGMTQGDAKLPDDGKFWIGNVEGVILPQYSAIGLGSLITYPGEHTDFATRMCFVTTPLVRNRPFAIIQKTLHANELYVAKAAIAAGEAQPPTTAWARLIGDAEAYDSTAHYAIGEQVTSGGTTYAAIQPVDGESLTDTAYWVPLISRRGMWDESAYAAGEVVAIPTLGEILIDGISRCTVIVGHASHNYAGVSALGIVSQAEPGPLEILYKDGTGEQYCIVRFCCSVIDSQTCTGTGALSLAALTSDGDGIRYGGNLITGVMTMAGVGTFSPPVCTGEDGPTLAALTISGSGKVYDPNPSGRLYFAAATMSGVGTVTNPPTGFSWLPFASMTMAGSGTVSPPTCTGSGAITFGVLKIDGGGLNLGDCCAPQDIEVYEETEWTTPCPVTVLVELTATGGMPTDAGSIGEDFISGGGGGGAYSASVLTLDPGTYSITEDADFVYFSDATPTVLVKAEKGTAGTVRLSSSGVGTAAGGAGGLASNGIGDVKYSGGDGGQGEIFSAFLAGGGGGGAGGRYADGDDGDAGVDGVTSSGQGGASGGSVYYLWDDVFPGDDFVSTGADGLTTGTTGYVPQFSFGNGISSGNVDGETTAGGESRFQARITVQSAIESASSLLDAAEGGGDGSPIDADYLVKTAHAGLSAERVVTDTTPITWDWGTSGQAKALIAGQTTLYGSLDALTLKGADIASATTTDIGAATGESVTITGTTTITGLGTKAAGCLRFVTFSGALTLTHNATSLILPTAANITTAAGDTAIFQSLGSGNWKCLNYTRVSGASLVGTEWTESNQNSDFTIGTTNCVLYTVGPVVGGYTGNADFPPATGNAGLMFGVKLINTYAAPLTLHADGSDEIDGEPVITLSSFGDCLFFYCTGSEWLVIADKRAENTVSTASIPGLCRRRLTLESGVAVSTSTQSAKGTIYWTPFIGNSVGLYNSVTGWGAYSPPEIAMPVAATSGKNYDVFAFRSSATPSSTDTSTDIVTFGSATGWNTGAAVTVNITGGGLQADTQYFWNAASTTTGSFHTTLANALAGTSKVNLSVSITAEVTAISLSQSSAWTNDTTRADALGNQDGAITLGSDATKLWLGGYRASASNVTAMEFSGASPKMFLSNWYNPVELEVIRVDTTASWTYATATWRQARASADNQIEVFTCTNAFNADVRLQVGSYIPAVNDESVGIGVDSTTPSADCPIAYGSSNNSGLLATKLAHRSLGYRVYKWCELRTSAGTATFIGEQTNSGNVYVRSMLSAALLA